MSSVFCTHCGAANPPGASFCQYCGSALTPPPSAPLPTSGAPAAPPPGWGAPGYGAAGYPPPPPPRRSRVRTIVIVLVVIVVVILILGVVSYLLYPSSSPSINITGINFSSPDNACGLDGATSSGFAANSSQAYPISFYISGNNTTNGGTAACTITTVSTTTAGFSITGANVPLQVPVNASPLLSFTVNCPSSPYTGVLTIVLT